jgi:hypothetical protein
VHERKDMQLPTTSIYCSDNTVVFDSLTACRNTAMWHAASVTGSAVLPFSKALAHPGLNPPEGHISQMEALRHYLLQVENQLWGVLDRGWTGVFSPSAPLPTFPLLQQYTATPNQSTAQILPSNAQPGSPINYTCGASNRW